MFAAVSFPDPLRFQAYPGVYALVAGLVGGYLALVWVVRVRVAEAPAPTVTARQWAAFAGAVLTVLVAGTWPVRGVADDYLAAAHALQLVLLALVFPPLFWLATPTWAKANAGASFTPSPVMATNSPLLCSSLTISTFWWGSTPA